MSFKPHLEYGSQFPKRFNVPQLVHSKVAWDPVSIPTASALLALPFGSAMSGYSDNYALKRVQLLRV